MTLSITTQTTLDKEIQICELWLVTNTRKLKNIKRGRTTYGYKHQVERYSNYYIHEDSFIQACKNLGYKISKNNEINLSII